MVRVDHDWHMFSVEHGYEVAHHGGRWLVRDSGAPDGAPLAELDDRQFDAWRTVGQPNPEGLMGP